MKYKPSHPLKVDDALERAFKLKAKAEAYDKGKKLIAIYGDDNVVSVWPDNYLGLLEKVGLPAGCSMRKVRIVDEIEKGAE